MFRFIITLNFMITFAIGATFNVNTTLELRQALLNAAQNGQDDMIVLADGTYRTTDDGQEKFVFLDNEPYELTLKGTSAENVILDGNNTNRVLDLTILNANGTIYIENISIINGNTGIYSSERLIVENCIFSNNQSTGYGAAIYSGESSNFNDKLTVKGSKFFNNTAIYGGAISGDSDIEIIDSYFFQNSGSYGGAAVQTRNDLSIINSSFIENYTTSGWSTILSEGRAATTHIENSIFLNNKSGDVYSASTYYKTTVTNSIFANDSTDSYDHALYVKNDLLIINSLFKNRSRAVIGNNMTVYNSAFSGNATSLSASTLVTNNNYIDEGTIDSTTSSNKDNIYEGVQLGFVDETNGDYHLTASSDLIDAGTTSVSGVTLPETDLDGNQRISGATIDIGPYEYSTTRPTINTFTYTGDAKVGETLTFDTSYTLTSGRTLKSIEYDYENSGTWTGNTTHVYTTSGTFTAKVRVTDSADEFSTNSQHISIAPITEYEQGYNAGRQACIDNPASCGIETGTPPWTEVTPPDTVGTSMANNNYNIRGYYMNYGSGNFDWAYLDLIDNSLYKLEIGSQEDGNLRWSTIHTPLDPMFESITISEDKSSVSFGSKVLGK